MRRLGIALSLSLVAGAVCADEAKVTSLPATSPAPFDGLLVPEVRMKQLLDAEVDAAKLHDMLKARDVAVTKAADELAVCRGEQASLFGRYRFAAGVVVGVVATAVLVHEVR